MSAFGFLENEPVSAIRFDLKGTYTHEVSINLNPDFRRRGPAVQMLEVSIQHLRSIRQVRKLFAALKRVEVPSMKTFSRAQFEFVGNPVAAHSGLERFDSKEELCCERFFST